MGACESKLPLTPNPYAPRTVAEYSKASQAKPTNEVEVELDKSFGLSRKFESMYEVVEEVGRRRRFAATAKRGRLKGQKVAVKIIPKSEMTTATATEGVRREVKILRAMKGHPNIAQFHEAFEDDENVYVVTELCEDGELLDSFLSRGGKFSEEEAKKVIVQILKVLACLHLQGIFHLGIKPENLMFASVKDEDSQLKVLDFGPALRGKEAPQVLRGSYGKEGDVWSIGVITYVLLRGKRPFRARTDSDEVLIADPCFDEEPWPSLSPESIDFVKRLLDQNPCTRLSAAQALCHPWLRNHRPMRFPIDILVFRSMKAYLRSSPLRKAALRALSKTLSEDELFYLKEQFAEMCLNPGEGSGGITTETIKRALVENRAGAIEVSNILNLLRPLKVLQFRKMYFEEFSAAAMSNIHLLDGHEQRARRAFAVFEKEGNRAIIIEELTSELKLSPTASVRAVVQEWIRPSDGKLSFHGFLRLLNMEEEAA